jgi:hypothetical protein
MSSKTTAQEQSDLQEQVKKLTEELAAERSARNDAESMAHALSQASQFTGVHTEEQPTGKTVKITKCLNPTERDEKKLRYKEVEVPTFAYTIVLPAGAGVCLSTNGQDFYHGQTYELDPDMLAEMKSRVARCWDHEKMVHGENENAYRKPTNSFVR